MMRFLYIHINLELEGSDILTKLSYLHLLILLIIYITYVMFFTLWFFILD